MDSIGALHRMAALVPTVRRHICKRKIMKALIFVPYLAVAVFLGAVVARWMRIARMPVHLRWELYPVGHEQNRHGGSFFEHLDWWNRRAEPSHLRELTVMVPEILLLKGVRDHNRSLWLRSYPFHGGLYLSAAFVVLLLAGAAAELFGVSFDAAAGVVPVLLARATSVVGLAALVLLAVGSLGLFLRRLSDPALREQSATADFLNLLFFFAAAAIGLLAFLGVDRDFSELRHFMAALLSFGSSADTPLLVAVEIVMGSALLAYIPLTHMSHFFTKWFMYHDVRWNDAVNVRGSALEAAIGRQLHYKVRWSAGHIQGGGQKTWVDVATEEVGKP
jgi:nitrate reductase gamma subunit